MLGIVGPNGSGKTSLLKVLARLMHPLQGRIDLFGQRVSLDGATRDRASCWCRSTRHTAAVPIYCCRNRTHGATSLIGLMADGPADLDGRAAKM